MPSQNNSPMSRVVSWLDKVDKIFQERHVDNHSRCQIKICNDKWTYWSTIYKLSIVLFFSAIIHRFSSNYRKVYNKSSFVFFLLNLFWWTRPSLYVLFFSYNIILRNQTIVSYYPLMLICLILNHWNFGYLTCWLNGNFFVWAYKLEFNCISDKLLI